MTTYQQLKAQLTELEEKAEAARKREKAAALVQIMRLVNEYDITPEEIFGSRLTHRSGDKRCGPVPIKYLNPRTGESWSGRGRLPRWLVGESREDFLILRAP
ncbi:H-NS histone family protein [Burkholderia alba]|uniref:H-NS histone family protein n=1 Tax=Burkholderia alba TaxID=2683677 RepID=UPI002B054BD0|nr:H-NS histone family protein [Burkholderia alba]